MWLVEKESDPLLVLQIGRVPVTASRVGRDRQGDRQ